VSKRRKAARVREPVQVYLDAPDLALLDTLSTQTGLAKAEVLRRGLRRLADGVLTERKPGWSLDVLIGAMGDDPSIPADLAERHDEYLYAPEKRERPRSR